MNTLLVIVCGLGASSVDPYEAYAHGDYAAALEAFQDLQTLSPQDLQLLERIGSTHYRLGNFDGAKRAYSQLAERVPEEIRSRVLYNLANTEFQRGQLLDAIDLYEQAIERDASDEDAQHNLALAKRILERRQQQQQQQPGKGEQEDERSGRNRSQSGDQPDNPSGQSQSSPSDGQPPPEQGQQNGDSPQPKKGDRDGDGIPNRIERRSEHGSDPRKADSDGDGLLDGEEDKNKNGRVDPGETDPTNQDSDGDGVPDARDGNPTTPDDQGQTPRPLRQGQPGQGLTEEEADRYLQILQEQPPLPKIRRQDHHVQEKDW